MSEAIPLFVVHLVGFGGLLWLGLYALTRGDGKSVAILTGITALVSAFFFFEGGLLQALHGAPIAVAVNRGLWWADVVPIALWLHLSVQLNPRAVRARWRLPVLGAAYGVALLLILFGTATNLLNDYSHIPVVAGPAYGLYAAYLLLCTGFAVVNFANTGGTRPALALAGSAPHSLRTATDAGTAEGSHRVEPKLEVQNTAHQPPAAVAPCVARPGRARPRGSRPLCLCRLLSRENGGRAQPAQGRAGYPLCWQS